MGGGILMGPPDTRKARFQAIRKFFVGEPRQAFTAAIASYSISIALLTVTYTSCEIRCKHLLRRSLNLHLPQPTISDHGELESLVRRDCH